MKNRQVCRIYIFVCFFVVLQENLHRVSLNLIRNDNALTDDKSYDMLKQRRCMIETMKRFEAVIFDMDGVIFDSELLVIKCWQVVADK